MKRTILFASVATFISLYVNVNGVQAIVIEKPAQGDVWTAGSIHEIEWYSYLYEGTIDVLFSEDGGGNWRTIESNVPNTGSYLWHLPDIVDSNQCLIKVVPAIPDSNIVCIESGLFTIHPDSPGPAVTSKWVSLGGDFKRTGLSQNYGPEHGCVKWRFETEKAVPTSVTIGFDDRVHIACEDGKLYTLDANGELLWCYDTNSPLTCSPTIGPDGTLYVGSQNGSLYAIDINGRLRWTHTTGRPIHSSPAVSEDGKVFLGSEDGVLYALASDGSELWTFQTKGPGLIPNGSIFAPPAIGANGTVYIAGLYDPNLYALDPNDGAIKWVCSSATKTGWPFASPVIAENGTIYQTLLYDSNLYAIEPNNGDIIWTKNLADPSSGWFDPNYAKDYGGYADGWSEPVLGPDGTIYVSFDDPYLRAVNPDGSIKWVAPLGTIGGFTLTVSRNGLIYAAGDDGCLYVVDQTGWAVTQFKSNSWLNYPVIARDNVIILTDANDKSLLITDQNNTLWAISQKGCRDLNFDGVVDFSDIALLAEYWLECTDANWPCNYQGEQNYLTADVDEDKYVRFSDLALIANFWRGSEKLLKPSPHPGPASNPSPPNGSTNVSPTYLSWTAGSFAVSHNIYFGTANPPPFVGSQTATTFKLGRLASKTTYYWRIDEVNPMGITTGELWSFTTGKVLCFPGDTPVWIEGALMPISKVVSGRRISDREGAVLAAYLPDNTNRQEVESVVEHVVVSLDCYDITLETGNRISVVDSHYFLLDCGQWVPTQDLKAGSKLSSLNGPVGIKSIAKRKSPFTGKVYNLKIKNGDRYFVGKDGLIVRDY